MSVSKRLGEAGEPVAAVGPSSGLLAVEPSRESATPMLQVLLDAPEARAKGF